MRQWLGDELEAELTQSLAPFTRREARWNALRRFKYRQLLRIGCRDILGDADLTVTTEELSRLADVCLAAACRWAEEALEPLYGAPLAADGTRTRAGRDRHGQAGRRRAQLLLRHRSHLRVRRRRGHRGRPRGVHPQRALLRGGGQGSGGGGGVGDGRGLRLPRRSPPSSRGALGRPHPLPRRVPGLLRGPRRAVGAPGPHQGARLRGRRRGGGAVLRAHAPLRVPARARRRHRGAGPGHEAGDRPRPARQGRRAAQREARPRRDPGGGVSRPGPAAALRGRRPVAARRQFPARPLPPHRARLSRARARPRPRRCARLSPHRRAPPADPPRVSDPHPARGAGGPRAPRAAHGHRAPARPRPPPLPRRVPARHRSPSTLPSGASSTRDRLHGRPPRAFPRSPRSRPPASSIRTGRGRTCG